jgi:hypothetical protein
MQSGQTEYRPGYQTVPVPSTNPSPLTREQFSEKQWSKSVLWRLSKTARGYAKAKPVVSRRALGRKADPAFAAQLATGLAEAMRLMAQASHRQRISRWFDEVKLQKVIVRNVVEATGELASAVARFVGMCADTQAQPEKKTMDVFCESRRKTSFVNWDGLGGNMQNPFFALNNARWHGADFLNMDVPSYYQQVQSMDLLSSNGTTVKYIEPTDSDQKQKEHPHTFEHYLAKSGFKLFNESLVANLPEDKNLLKNRIERFLKESSLLLPEAALDRILGK